MRKVLFLLVLLTFLIAGNSAFADPADNSSSKILLGKWEGTLKAINNFGFVEEEVTATITEVQDNRFKGIFTALPPGDTSEPIVFPVVGIILPHNEIRAATPTGVVQARLIRKRHGNYKVVGTIMHPHSPTEEVPYTPSADSFTITKVDD